MITHGDDDDVDALVFKSAWKSWAVEHEEDAGVGFWMAYLPKS